MADPYVLVLDDFREVWNNDALTPGGFTVGEFDHAVAEHDRAVIQSVLRFIEANADEIPLAELIEHERQHFGIKL